MKGNDFSKLSREQTTAACGVFNVSTMRASTFLMTGLNTWIVPIRRRFNISWKNPTDADS